MNRDFYHFSEGRPAVHSIAFEMSGSTPNPGVGLSLTALSHTLGLLVATHELGTGVQRDERHLVVWISTPDELCGVLA